jgi:gluconolactonase
MLTAENGTLAPYSVLPLCGHGYRCGGLKRNRLFMAASQSVYAPYVNTQGALGG